VIPDAPDLEPPAPGQTQADALFRRFLRDCAAVEADIVGWERTALAYAATAEYCIAMHEETDR
jgi:hypothetical protein